MIHDSNYKYVGLGLLIGQKKQFKDLTLEVWEILLGIFPFFFFFFFLHFY